MEKRTTPRKVKVGAFRVAEPQKLPPTDPRSSLAKRYRGHLRGLESSGGEVVDPDVEVRRGPPAKESSRSPLPHRDLLAGIDVDDDLD